MFASYTCFAGLDYHSDVGLRQLTSLTVCIVCYHHDQKIYILHTVANVLSLLNLYACYLLFSRFFSSTFRGPLSESSCTFNARRIVVHVVHKVNVYINTVLTFIKC